MYTTKCLYAATAVTCLLGTAQAAPPSTSAYATDPQSEYVQDTTADSISSLNMVLCVFGSMSAGDMVNTGPYIALVDMNKCDTKKASAAAAGATNYATAVVDVTRATNNDPMLGKVWLSMTEQGSAVDVFIHLSATESPSSTQPYGLFRLDYLGKKNGMVGFNGFVDSQASSISQYEIGNNGNNGNNITAMALSASSTTAGAGTITAVGGPAFNFAYDATHFRRSDGTNDQCFDRSKANAEKSVWQYGTYNALDGSRVDMAHPGFPVVASYAGNSYYGFANYWGINFQGLDLNTIPDAQPISGLTVTDQRPSNTTSYTLSKVGGKLTKWTQQATTLDSLNNIPINFNGDLTGLTNNSQVTGFQWQIQWSSANQAFTVIGQQQCDSNGCHATPLSPAALVNASAFNDQPISGWADSYGGNINIPATGASHMPGDAVYYYLQSTVVPGSAALSLYCLSQCPTAASLTAFAAGTQSSPFGNGTDQQWFTAPAANTMSYSFDAGGLEDGSGGTAHALVLEQASQYPQGSMYAQSGINTGRLFDAPLVSANCPMVVAGTVCEPANPSSYYTWATGPQQWQQSLWLNNGTVVVALDAPQNISYTVPNDPALYGSYAGVPILLQFNGFGNLYGIPGSCVDPVNNAPVQCNVPNARYVPLFAIPDGATMTLPSPSTPLIVKALNAEIRLKNLGANAAACSSMTLAGIAPPTGGTHDPSNSADSFYIGVKPTVTAAPKVIDGVVQP
jgi:hypothetical protein